MILESGWSRPALVVGVISVLFLAACSSNPDRANGGDVGTDATGATSGDLSGDIKVSGSSTVEPITSIVLEDFTALHPDVTYSVDGPGTGDGFALFCEGAIDVADASRPIREEEIAACEEAGIDYVELRVGIDGISVITSPENDAVSCLSFADLYALTGPESQGVDNWSDAEELAEELGSGDHGEIHTPYPDAALDITAPGEESGTYDTYVEFVVTDLAEERGADEVTRPDYQTAADDNVIIENVGGSPSSLGWVGFAFADENAEAVKSIEIDGGDGCVAPTAETIASGEYPMSRPLFIYVNTDSAAERPELEAFVDYFLSDQGIAAVTEAAYVALEGSALEETRSTWDGR